MSIYRTRLRKHV